MEFDEVTDWEYYSPLEDDDNTSKRLPKTVVERLDVQPNTEK